MSFDVCLDGTQATPHVAPRLAVGRRITTEAAIVAHGADSPKRALLEDFVRREFEQSWANADTKLAVADLYGNVNTAKAP